MTDTAETKAHARLSPSGAERWVNCLGYEGKYEVSDLGRVRNSVTGRVLKPQPFPNGYRFVTLGRGNCELIHRLVAKAFIPGNHALQVNHKDGKREHNAAPNLEWTTCSDNHRHSYRELDRKPHAKKRAVKVGAIVYESGLAAATALGVNPGSVMSAIHRNHRVCGLEATYA